MSEADTTPPIESAVEAAPVGGAQATSKKAVYLSAVIVVGLLGGVVGMFAAMGEEEDSARIADGGVVNAAGWIGDASASPEENGSGYAAGEPVLDPADEDQEDIGAGVEGDENILAGEVKSGTPVIKNLTNLGISTGDAQLMINALDGIYDFRRSRPGHKFQIRLHSQTKAPVSFRYEASLTDVYIAKRNGDGFEGHKANIPTLKKVRLYGGTISSSLYRALDDLGARPSLASAIADVLSTQVNFFKEQRPGDTFRVMVEEESLDGKFLGYGPVLALEYIGVKAGKKRFFRFQPGSNANPTYYDEKGVSVPTSAIMVPLHYTRMSSPFGMRYHPVLKRKKLHNGTDFAASPGTPVWACSAGTITCAGMRGANGNLVSIDHGGGLSSHYAHLSRFGPGIKKGVKVKQRQVIGYVGNTGRSTGAHLHWGLKLKGKFLDPLKYKIRPGRPVAPKYRSKLKGIIAQRSAKLDKTGIQPPKGPLAEVPEAGDEVLGLEEDF